MNRIAYPPRITGFAASVDDGLGVELSPTTSLAEEFAGASLTALFLRRFRPERGDESSRFLAFDPLRVPIEIAFVAINDVARLFEIVELARINHELSGDIKAAQCLIHLFGVKKRHVEIAFAAEK